MRAASRLLGDAVAAAAAGLPEGRRLRVIELGAGAGSVTSAIVGALPADRIDYLYADLSSDDLPGSEARSGDPAACIERRSMS